MYPHRSFWLAISLLVGIFMLTACGPELARAPAKPDAASPSIAAGEKLFILDGSNDNRQIIAFQPASTSSVRLPMGLFTQDHKYIYTATPQSGQTTINVLDTHNGDTLHTFSLPGNYTTTGPEYTTSLLTPDGHWLALLASRQGDKDTTIALVDTQRWQSRLIQLPGIFDLDAISPDASKLYLLQHDEDQQGHYYVRSFDVTLNQLTEGYILDKTAASWDSMSGLALTRQMAKDGTMAYTLYTDVARNIAFVHILPLTGNAPFARCLTLPAGKSVDLLSHYSLALSSDGRTLYATNSSLGVVVSMDVSYQGDAVLENNIKSITHFPPENVNSPGTATLYNGATTSPDQSRLYFVGIHGVWMMDIGTSKVEKQFMAEQTFTGLAISSDGHTLYALSPISGLSAMNVISGASQTVDKCPAHKPQGIAWISN